MTSDDDRTDDRELRATAIHEAGHLIAIRALGGIGHARVWANEPARESETVWCGRTVAFLPPDVPGWQVIVGLAGLVAELAERCRNDADAIADEIASMERLDEISASDAATVRTTLDLLLPRWSELLWEADWMEKSCRTAV